MAYRMFCSNTDCNKPIDPKDDHLEIPQLVIVDKQQLGEIRGLHFCGGKSCLNKFLDKALNRPLLISQPVNGSN